MTDLDNLRAAATEVLRLEKGDGKKATASLAIMLTTASNRTLLIALIADFLSRLRVYNSKAKPAGRRREGRHRRLGMPTAQNKAGAIAASKIMAADIFDHKIRGGKRLGDVRVHELRAMSQTQAAISASFFLRGYDDGVEAIMFAILNDHCVASDPHAKIADTIPKKVAAKAFEDAKVKAAEVMRDAAATVAEQLIASARAVEAIEAQP